MNKWLLAIIVLIVVVPLAIRTRGAIFALLPIALPWLIPLVRDYVRRTQGTSHYSSPSSRANSSGPVSEIETAFLRLRLDHDSGTLTGSVIAGTFAGAELTDLSCSDWLTVWAECAADPQSQAAMESFLDNAWPDWQTTASNHRRTAAADPSSSLSEQDAYAILGLAPGADKAAIIAAHRRLMQRVHPDHGGTDYLAERINAAKERLLQ